MCSADTAIIQPVSGLEAVLASELGNAGASFERHSTVGSSSIQQTAWSPEDDLYGLHGPPPASNAFPMPVSEELSTLRSSEQFLKVKCGPVTCLSPTPGAADRYLDFYFAHINPFHPCLNESEMQQRSMRLYDDAFGPPSSPHRQPTLPFSSAPLLSLLFSIYSCVDVLRQPHIAHEPSRLPGFIWYRQAQELGGKRQVTATGTDLTGIQILILQVRDHGCHAVLTLGPLPLSPWLCWISLCRYWTCLSALFTTWPKLLGSLEQDTFSDDYGPTSLVYNLFHGPADLAHCWQTLRNALGGYRSGTTTSIG